MSESEKIKSLHEQLIAFEEVKFPETGRVKLTNEQGVYIIYSPRNKVLHVGKTNDGKNGLNQRLYNHLTNSSSFSREYLKCNGQILRSGYKIKYLEVKSGRIRALLEALSAGLLCPAHIGTGEKRID